MCLVSNNWNEWMTPHVVQLIVNTALSLTQTATLVKMGKTFNKFKRCREMRGNNYKCLLPVIRWYLFPWLTLLLRNLILCYIWTSLYNRRPLCHIMRINVISILMMMMMMLVVIDSVTYVWALYMGCVSTHGAERHIWHTWLRLLLLLFSFFSTFDFVDDEISSVKVMIHTKPALFWG